MRVLIVHNRYLIRAGEDESVDAEYRVLKDSGVKVDLFEETNQTISRIGVTKTALRTIWSQKAFSEIKELILRNRYDVVHLQNFFPLISPSVIWAASRTKAAVVHSLRNYRLLCPAATLFRNGHICDSCVGKVLPWPALLHGCYRDSRLATLPIAAMLAAHRKAGTWKNVDAFIALSAFARQKFIDSGFPHEKIFIKPNFVNEPPKPGVRDRNFVLFVGRLAPEKGLQTLLEAWKSMPRALTLKIIGEGPGVKRGIMDSVHWEGRKSLTETYAALRKAAFLVFPSQWFEPFGRTIIEAFAAGTPVIASNVGASPELITPGQTGLLFEAGNVGDLAEKLEWAMTHPQEMADMGKRARLEFESKYTAQENLGQLLNIYKMAIDRAAVRLGAK